MRKNKRIEKEIEVLKESKETDKFDYNNSVSLLIALLALMTSLVILFAEKNNVSFVKTSILWIIFFIFIVAFMYFINFRGLVHNFRKKHLMIRKRYKSLGVNLKKMNKELENTSLKEE